MRLPLSIFFILTTLVSFSQKNLGFEKWDINNLGIDEAKNWTNIADASKYGASQVLFKEVENPSGGMASIKLKTAYWKDGANYGLDTLVGCIMQEAKIKNRPYGFEFSYQSFPAKGDEVLVGIQLTSIKDGELVVIGEAYFTSASIQNNWERIHVPVTYFSDETPETISFIALSSANATILTGENGYAKIGSTLWLDDVKIIENANDISSPHFTLLSASQASIQR